MAISVLSHEERVSRGADPTQYTVYTFSDSKRGSYCWDTLKVGYKVVAPHMGELSKDELANPYVQAVLVYEDAQKRDYWLSMLGWRWWLAKAPVRGYYVSTRQGVAYCRALVDIDILIEDALAAAHEE